MRKILLALFCLPVLIAPIRAMSQTFLQADTVRWNYTAAASIPDNITIPGSTAVNLRYHVIACNFPADWLVQAAFGICDGVQCRNNIGDTMLWNRLNTTGTSFTCSYSGGATGSFSLSPDLSAATSTGTYYCTIMVAEAGLGGYSKTTTFILSKNPVSVPTVANTEDKVALYPNPATDEVNIVYDASADVKNIAVYSVIGKLMTVYKVTGNTSANLNIESIPSGIYFVRLFNGNGNVVSTRKFTKQ